MATFSRSWADSRRQRGGRAPPSVTANDNSDSDDSSTLESCEDLSQFTPVPKDLLGSIIIIGADGNLSSRKILPTLFNCWRRKLLPRDIIIFGYARAALDDDTFRKHVFKCIYNPSQPQSDRKGFMSRCHYQAGQFSDATKLRAMIDRLATLEDARRAERLKEALPLSAQLLAGEAPQPKLPEEQARPRRVSPPPRPTGPCAQRCRRACSTWPCPPSSTPTSAAPFAPSGRKAAPDRPPPSPRVSTLTHLPARRHRARPWLRRHGCRGSARSSASFSRSPSAATPDHAPR